MIVKEPEAHYGVPTQRSYSAQANVISRAAYRMPAMARRLIFCATALVQADQDPTDMWVEMNVGDVVRALGLNDSTKSYKAVRESAREAMRQFFEFEDTDGSWRMHHWISTAEYKQDTDTVRIRFAKEMAPLIIDIKRDFSMLSIADYGKLQGRHAQRIYELIMAESGHEGRNGNRRGYWWMQVDKQRLRKLLMIEDNEYPRTSNFRMRVVDDPVREINEADIGIRIKVEYEYKGRELYAFKFHVERIGQSDPKPRNPATQGEVDQEAWIEANPKAWEECLELARGQGDLFDEKSSLDRLRLEGEAWKHFIARIKSGGLRKPPKGNK